MSVAILEAPAEFRLLEFPTVPVKEQTVEKPAINEAKPIQGDVVVVRTWLEDLRVYPDRYVVVHWREDSPNIHIGGWLVNWQDLLAHIREERVSVIRKRG